MTFDEKREKKEREKEGINKIFIISVVVGRCKCCCLLLIYLFRVVYVLKFILFALRKLEQRKLRTTENVYVSITITNCILLIYFDVSFLFNFLIWVNKKRAQH